jgi:hypothetical protein
MTRDERQGFYRKYDVKRLGGTPGKHDDCTYYVLDLMHDAFAQDALRAYANACRDVYPELAADLDRIVNPEVSFFGSPWAWRSPREASR